MVHVSMMRQSSSVYDEGRGGYPERDGAVVGLEQAYYEVGICLICTFDDTNFIAVNIC